MTAGCGFCTFETEHIRELFQKHAFSASKNHEIPHRSREEQAKVETLLGIVFHTT
jgi:hypothetical protein